jgi:hypothetical protein
MCVCVCTCMQMYAPICIYECTCVYVCMHTCICITMNEYMYVHIHVYACMYVRTIKEPKSALSDDTDINCWSCSCPVKQNTATVVTQCEQITATCQYLTVQPLLTNILCPNDRITPARQWDLLPRKGK